MSGIEIKQFPHCVVQPFFCNFSYFGIFSNFDLFRQNYNALQIEIGKTEMSSDSSFGQSKVLAIKGKGFNAPPHNIE